MKFIREYFFSKTAYQIYMICFGGAAIWGYLHKPFYLHFLNALTILGVIITGIGVFHWSYLQGDYSFYSWKPDKDTRLSKPGEKRDPSKDPATSMSYRAYREYVRESHKDEKEHFLAPGLLVTAIAMILSFLY